jgi:Zn-dependent protease
MTAGRAPICRACGATVAEALLACPVCDTLVHTEALKSLAADAASAKARGDDAAALAAWERALTLLPSRSTQWDRVFANAQAIRARLAPVEKPRDEATPRLAKRAGAMGAIALVLWKIESIALALFSIAKPFALGLTKAPTLLSMLASIGVYWAAFGWRFAIGLVATTYVHEIGHVVELRRLGIAASAPMFVPGLGAFVRLRAAPSSASDDARAGLAGPRFGLAASLACVLIGLAADAPAWLAIGRVSAWINLFNLLPLGSLDGGRAFRPLGRGQRWALTALIAIAYLLTGEAMLILIGLGALLASLASPGTGDRRAAVEYAALMVMLVAIGWVTAGKVQGAG